MYSLSTNTRRYQKLYFQYTNCSKRYKAIHQQLANTTHVCTCISAYNVIQREKYVLQAYMRVAITGCQVFPDRANCQFSTTPVFQNYLAGSDRGVGEGSETLRAKRFYPCTEPETYSHALFKYCVPLFIVMTPTSKFLRSSGRTLSQIAAVL